MESIGDVFSAAAASKPAADREQMDHLQEVLDEGLQLEQLVQEKEEELKVFKRQLLELKQTRLPKLMDDLGVSMLQRDGWTVKVEDFVSGTLPKEPSEREKALAWLIEHGQEGLIKNSILLNFGKGEHNIAHDLAERLRGEGFEPQEEQGVHPQTLWAWAREAMRSGDDIDQEVLGLYLGRRADFKAPKARKGV
jgi:hypothetical protein